MTRYRLLTISALLVIAAGLALGSSVTLASAAASAANMKHTESSPAASATSTPTPVPTATATPIPKPCLALAEVSCGAAGQQTVNPQIEKTITITGLNWRPLSRVTIYLVKGIGACASTLHASSVTVIADKSGNIQGSLSTPANAKDGDTYQVCAQQGNGVTAIKLPAVLHISQPSQASAAPLFDTYSAAALLLLLISVLAGVPELLRMSGSQARQ